VGPSSRGLDSRPGCNQPPRSTQPSIPVGLVNQVPTLLAGVKAECARLCRVASNIVWSHMASDTL